MMLREAWSRRVTGSWAREFALFGTSTFIYQAGRFVFSLAAAYVLAAAEFTAWAVVIALIAYAPSLTLGVTNGMSRELPIFIGERNEGHARRAEDAAWAATWAATAVVTIVAVLAGAIVASDPWPVVLAGGLAAGTIVYHTGMSVLRSHLRFDAASAQQATFGVAALLLAVALAMAGEVGFETVAACYGLCIVTSIAAGIGIARPALSAVDVAELRRLGRIGLPIMLAGLIFTFYVTLDRWIAVTLLGQDGAAPYALASLIAAAVLVVPSVVSQQTYPRMGIARGRDASVETLRNMARDQGLIGAAIVIPLAVSMTAFAWAVIPVLLPDYAEAAPAVVILVAGLVVLAFLTGYGNYLNVVGGQWRYLAAQVIGLATALTLMMALGQWLGLIGIALGMSISHVVYGIVLRAAAMRTGIRSEAAVAMAIEPS